MTDVSIIDLEFMGVRNAVAVYLISHARGAVLVECGPGSTCQALQDGLRAHGKSLSDITDVLLTHIHLDHAGAAGWLARQGARIHVHPNGAPHLINPEKLMASAGRIYGDKMEILWGEMLAVPESQLNILQDQQGLLIEGLRFLPIDTPGHASHHFVYVFEDICFAGDVGGVRLPGPPHVRVPMPPPEFHLEKWRASIKKMEAANCTRIAPTHFGIYNNAPGHLARLTEALDEVEAFLQEVLPSDPPVSEITTRFMTWTEARSRRDGLFDEIITAYETANPSWMSAAGMQRYWRTHRARM